jgi:hypothetical protein
LLVTHSSSITNKNWPVDCASCGSIVLRVSQWSWICPITSWLLDGILLSFLFYTVAMKLFVSYFSYIKKKWHSSAVVALIKKLKDFNISLRLGCIR